MHSTSFSSDVLLTMGTNLFMAMLILITGPLSARILGPEGRGELAAIQLWAPFLSIPIMLGLPAAVVYYAARERENAGIYTLSSMVLNCAAALLILPLAYFLLPLLLRAQNPATIVAAQRYLLLFIPIQMLSILPASTLRGMNELFWWNFFRILPNVVWLLTLLLGLFLGHTYATWFAFVYLGFLFLHAIPRLLVLRRRITGPFRPRAAAARPLLKFGLPSLTGSIFSNLNFRLDQMLMAALIAPELLGLYAVAVAWSNAVGPVVQAIGQVLYPRVAAQTTARRQAETMVQGAHLGVIVAVGVTIPVMLLTPLAIPLLFGPAFVASVPVSLVLVAAGLFNAIKIVLQEGALGLGSPKAVLAGEAVGLLFTALALALLLRPLGIMGAAIASLLGYLATTGVLLLQVSRLICIHALTLLVPTRDDFALLRRKAHHLWRSLAAVPSS